MCVTRNFAARNFGVVARVLQVYLMLCVCESQNGILIRLAEQQQVLRKILVTSQSFGDAERADYKSKLSVCRGEEFRNEGMVMFFEALEIKVKSSCYCF